MSHRVYDEHFVKSQLVAFCKALSKAEAPLKQKHVRALIVGTHKQRSARIFWHAVSRVQLEKNPVLTWKFCHLLHKLIRDGHRKVADDSLPHCNRLVQLGNFWQHLRTSGYGQANTTYCNMLVSRLHFHKKYPSIAGSLCLVHNQLEVLTKDINETYELAIDMLDQMDELLGLKATVMNIMDSFRWSSLIPQGQCLLAPLILVILDTSKFYDFLVKALFKLHARISPDTLVGHRERFYELFRQTKKFYEEASSLQYFKYLVSIPTLPSVAPNFLQASDLDSYQTPQAYLRVDGSSESGGDASPPDGQSMDGQCDEDTIIDFTVPPPEDLTSAQLFDDGAVAGGSSQTANNGGLDPREEEVHALRRDVSAERKIKEHLIQEARIRIEQYESRLVQMKQEMDAQRRSFDARTIEMQTLQQSAAASTAANDEAATAREDFERRMAEKEQKFSKLKGVYDNLRQEHITTLTQIRDLKMKSDEATELERKVAELSLTMERLSVENVGERQEKLAKERRKALESVCTAALLLLEQSQEDLQNATSISYPTHLAENYLRTTLQYLNEPLMDALKVLVAAADGCDSDMEASSRLLEYAAAFAHRLSQSSVICASAAYTASIESFEPVNEQCRRALAAGSEFYTKLKELKEGNGNEALTQAADHLRPALAQLEASIKALPSSGTAANTDIDAEAVGTQVEEEMKRMDAAIQNAVTQIEQLQRKAREQSTGVRLEVNDKILDACNSLMEAVRRLVRKSRDVQEEIVASGRGGGGTATEFYKRNHLWTEGLLSAARAVGVAATVIVSSADGVITGTSKFEHLIVAAQEVCASVAQLFVSSRVKADKNSVELKELAAASRAVNACTGALVAAAKTGQQSLSDEKLLDFTNFSLHEAKKEEMESQVRMLELEAELCRERNKLAALRKQHYHLASLVANNNKEQQQQQTPMDGSSL